MKAKVAPVQVGSLVVEGLQLPDGSYAIALSQAVKLLSFTTQNNATRELKALLGKDISLLKIQIDTTTSHVRELVA